MQARIFKAYFALSLLMFVVPSSAVDVPANMIITGTITGSATVEPKVDDRVLIKNESGTLEGQGTVIDTEGTYAIDLSKNTDFNGTVLIMQFQQGSAVYNLSAGGIESGFTYNGGLFPVRLTINPLIGELVSGSVNTGGSGGDTSTDTDTDATEEPNFDTKFDVNTDGVFNQTDIDQIKQQVSSGAGGASSDVNGDGVVNTRDIIDAIKAFRVLNRRAV